MCAHTQNKQSAQDAQWAAGANLAAFRRPNPPGRDRGQTCFGHPYLAAFSQTEFGQDHIWPQFTGRIWPSSFAEFGRFLLTEWRMWPILFLVGPEGWAEGVGGPKISRFFFSLPLEISFFLLSLGFFVEFWCLKHRDAHIARLVV